MAFEIEVEHPGLGRRVIVRARTREEAQWKAEERAQRWNAQYDRQLATEARRQIAADLRASKDATREEASTLTAQAAEELAAYEGLLSDILAQRGFDFPAMRHSPDFSVEPPPAPKLEKMPEMPERNESRFQPTFGFLGKVFPSLKQKKIKGKSDYFDAVFAGWVAGASSVERGNSLKMEVYNARLAEWESKKAEHEIRVVERNSYVDSLQDGVARGDREAVETFLENALSNLNFPSSLSGDFDVTYIPESKTVVVDFYAPSLDRLELTKEYKYVSSRNEIKEVPFRKSEIQSIYDNVIYQLCLGIRNFIFKCVTESVIEIVVCNSWVEYLNVSTGNDVVACVASLQIARSDFDDINISKVEPKACFRALKGVSAPQIHTLTPIRPILHFDKNDARFVESRGVIDSMETGTNIAAIGWEEFEHLVREVFEKEFSSSGGEVKVTQASRDGGVDAVAFDPDPIRGGKIVIQAKRYTNTVGVSAVRDLFGTVVAEGATKGILVTTAAFGPDAYAFAKGKPLTLLEGSHLLHLMGKHGHRVRIDLAEAKRLGASMNR